MMSPINVVIKDTLKFNQLPRKPPKPPEPPKATPIRYIKEGLDLKDVIPTLIFSCLFSALITLLVVLYA